MQTMVGEVMTTAVARVRPETPVTQVARLLRERGVTAVPVVDEEDHVLGVVSAMDLAMDSPTPGRHCWDAWRAIPHARAAPRQRRSE